ncbi:MAG: carbohydrate kinase [Sulfitobacter sp.]
MILCCGEALIDMIPEANLSGRSNFAPHAGGAIFNTAIALGRLDVSCGFVSGISTDLFGKILLSELQASKVNTDNVIASDRPTTLAFVELTDGHATYVFYDENTAGRMLQTADLPDIPSGTSAMYFGGISLISEPAADFYVDLALRHANDCVIIADPNIRSGFIKDEAAYRARLDRLIAHVDIIKVSDEDLDWIVPGPLTHVEKAEILREMGPAIVVLTKGSAGASAIFGDDGVVQVPVQKVKVADTVGAGDTFNAGFLASLSENDLLSRENINRIDANDLKNALEYGAKVAAITVSRPGANPPWAHELL